MRENMAETVPAARRGSWEEHPRGQWPSDEARERKEAELRQEYDLGEDVKLEFHFDSNREWYVVRDGHPTMPLHEYLEEAQNKN